MFIKKAFKSNNRYITLFLLVIVFVIAFVATVKLVKGIYNENKVAEKFQKNVLTQLQSLENKANTIKDLLETNDNNLWPLLERSVNQDNTLCLIHKNDSLVFWNNSQISTVELNDEPHQHRVVHTNNGWYLLHSERHKDYKILLYKQIKSDYQYDNLILPSIISDDFALYQDISFTFDQEASIYRIHDHHNHFLVGMIFENYSPFNDNIILILFILFVAIYILVIEWIRSLYQRFRNYFKSELTILFLFTLDLIVLRVLDIYFHFPAILKDSFLFDTNPTFLTGFNSIGDTLISSLLIIFIAIQTYLFYKRRSPEQRKVGFSFKIILLEILLIALAYCISYVIYQATLGLPFHSFFGADLSGATGILTIVSILFLAFSLLYFGRAIGNLVLKYNTPIYVLYSIIIGVGLIAYYLIDLNQQILVISLLFVLLLHLILYYQKNARNINFIKYMFFIVLVSAAVAIIVNSAIKQKRDFHQMKIAEKLSTSSDSSLEEAFFLFEKELTKDTLFQQLVFNDDVDKEYLLTNHLSHIYFKDFLRYNIQLTVCEKGENLMIEPSDLVIDCSEYFDNQIELFGEQKNSSSFYLIRGEPKSIYYIGKLLIADPNDPQVFMNVYAEFYFTFIPEGLGYPELLIDNTLFELDLSGYSYAQYRNNQLLKSFGSYPYQTSYEYLREFLNKDFFVFGNARHYKLQLAQDEFLIVSRPTERMAMKLVTFSCLFLIVAIILFVAFFIVFGKEARKVFQMSFQTRLQMIFISTISLIIALLAIITIYYVEAANKQNLADQLTEKTNSVLIELDHKLSSEYNLENYDPFELQQLLQKFSLVFASDINVYRPAGELLASSRPEIFNRGLISEYVNPMAFEELFVKNKLYYLTEESIGNVSYFSSYAPLILGSGQTAGILNLPYFARQSELTRSYYLMIFTFLNLFVILGILGAFLAIGLSRIITRPLVVLQKSLAGIQIDKRNEMIDWESDDEIGLLIAEYNRMIDKLEQSTELLKQSERESAWREVAKQIAHEIKNPLTPMKLNVQYLEKAFIEKDPNFGDKVKNISAALVSQIDTLNKVAEMFSDFATSNVRHFEKVDLQKVLSESIQLFKNNPEAIITFDVDQSHSEYIILGFEKDLLRLFNNLIKNAIQSINSTDEGLIQITLNVDEGHYLVRIKDNGKGIPNEAKANIFQPYFTTKSGGTGLGLAIVKNIMNEIGGQIRFESGLGEGTVFILKFKQV